VIGAVRKRLFVAVVVAVFVLLPQADKLVTAPYDSWTHLFFASHYLQGWFASVDTRWYLGLPVYGYPPLAHQLLAVVSVPFARLGFDTTDALTASYTVLALVCTALYPLAVYAYSRVLVSKRAASYGALVASVFTGWWALLLGYGQFPTLIAAVVTMLGGAALYGTLRTGSRRNLVVATLLTALVPMTHHFTSISFLVAVYLVVVVTYATRDAETGVVGDSDRRERLLTTARRATPVAVGSVALALLAMFPFVAFLVTGSSQPPIPHGSRQSWLEGAVWSRPQPYFTLVTGGLFLFLAPLCGLFAYRREDGPALFAVALAVVCGVLSLGFTTPLPRILYPGLAETLTYFRFAAWGGFLLLPVVGWLIAETCDDGPLGSIHGHHPTRRRIVVGFVAVLLLSQVVIATQVTNLGAASPDRRAAAAEVGDFMSEDEHWKWRYLTLGMSQELGLVGIEAPNAQTVDGNYNEGRRPSRVPVLANSSAAQLSSAKFSPAGRRVLDHYLANNREMGIKFVFSADVSYEPTLREHGFEVLYEWEALDVRVWHDPATPPALEREPSPARQPTWQMYFWGIVPLATLFALLVVISPSVVTSLSSGADRAPAD